MNRSLEQSPLSLEEAFEAAAANALDIQAQVEAQIAAIEAKAFDSYRRHGLPTIRGVYFLGDDGTWQLAGDFDNAGAELNLPLDHKKRPHRTYFELAREAEPNSELAFAADVLEAAYICRDRLSQGGWSPEAAFLDAVELASSVHALIVEFDLGPTIAPARKQAAGRSEGGKKRASSVSAERAQKIRRWRELDQDLPPHLTRSARAVLIKKKVDKDPKFQGSIDKIRRVLPDRKNLAGS